MDISRLIEALSNPDAVEKVEVRQTHISVVFLSEAYAYKIKKPVNLGFLDFSTLEKRRHFCLEEVRLNRRLAPSVYRGVVPITRVGTAVRLEGAGEPIEWAVKMERLPEQATLLERLRRREIGEEQVKALAERVASFHAAADAGPTIAAYGRLDVVARNARENFEQAQSQVGVTVSRPVFERLQSLTEETLARLGPLIEGRADWGVPRDTHGDLHLDHVYLFPEAPPPGDLVIIDCIEFNERFRFADPVADMAFVAMDLAFNGRRDLARLFIDGYFQAAEDAEGIHLAPFYSAYRAVVRAKVEAFRLDEVEVPEPERSAALDKSQAHWLLALAELERPGQRPCLVLIAGLPGTGKSTLSRHLAERASFRVVRSDEVRKELAARAGVNTLGAGFAEGIYASPWTERTYAECLRWAGDLLFRGERVIVDANFREEKQRCMFLDMARRAGVPTVLLLCRAKEETVRKRLQSRRGDASDANWDVHQRLAAQWEEIGEETRRSLREIDTEGNEREVLGKILAIFHGLGLTG
jgi:aminoglycoside phosphotransferase family enzyme/predicted kinase